MPGATPVSDFSGTRGNVLSCEWCPPTPPCPHAGGPRPLALPTQEVRPAGGSPRTQCWEQNPGKKQARWITHPLPQSLPQPTLDEGGAAGPGSLREPQASPTKLPQQRALPGQGQPMASAEVARNWEAIVISSLVVQMEGWTQDTGPSAPSSAARGVCKDHAAGSPPSAQRMQAQRVGSEPLPPLPPPKTRPFPGWLQTPGVLGLLEPAALGPPGSSQPLSTAGRHPEPSGQHRAVTPGSSLQARQAGTGDNVLRRALGWGLQSATGCTWSDLNMQHILQTECLPQQPWLHLPH